MSFADRGNGAADATVNRRSRSLRLNRSHRIHPCCTQRRHHGTFELAGWLAAVRRRPHILAVIAIRDSHSPNATVKWLTGMSLAGITLGIAIGVVVSVLVGERESPGADLALLVGNSIVRAWTNAFRLLVAPLVVAQLYLAMSAERRTGISARRLGIATPVTFGGLLALTVLVTVLLVRPLLSLDWIQSVTLAPATVSAAAPAAPSLGSTWIDGLVPPNLFAAASSDNILPLMLVALAFAVAMRRADADANEAVTRVVRGVSQASFTVVEWLLRLTPVVMLAIGFTSALTSGFVVGEAILAYAALEIALTIVAIAMLYVVIATASRVSLVRFARAVWPAQLAAAATRSSLATLPLLIRAAEGDLRLHKETAGAVLPVAGATLKLSQAVSHPVKLLFLATVLGLDVTPERLLIFSATIMLLSASVPGVPSVTSGNRSLPAFIAAGIPVEYVVMMGVATSLSDVFQTVLNSTGYITAATLVDRVGVRATHPSVPLAPDPEVLAEAAAAP